VCSNCHAVLTPSGKGKRSERADPLIGQQLGEFEITELLGRGGMGAVYKARQPSLDRFVAIKVLPRDLSADASFIERFSREARAAAATNHPNIIDVYAIAADRGYHYIAMELVDGESLADMVHREGRLRAERALPVMKQVATALAEAHACGILHRDIKPSNILITSKGLAKVADFGLAKRTGSDGTITGTGQTIGTPLYFAPEAARGGRFDVRSDLYSLGGAFYHALAGRPPFQASSAVSLALKHAEAPVPPLAEAAPEAPPALCRIIHRLLRKNPADRYPSANELLAVLERVEARVVTTQAEPIQARPGAAHRSLAERLEAKKQQRRKAALVAGGCGLAVVVLVVLVLILPGGDRGAKPQQGAQAITPTPKARVEPRQPTPPKQAPRPDAVPEKKRPKPSPKPKVSKPTPKAKPKATAWEAAWKEASAKAEAFAAEQRFADAVAQYNALADRFDELAQRQRLNDAILAIQKQAKEAYREAERTARQLMGAKEFAEARAALRPVVERYGLPEKAEEAKKLLAAIDKTEKDERAAVARAAKEAAEKAEKERREAEKEKRRQAEARYAKALRPIEAMLQAWDFRRGAAALARLRFKEKHLAARAATRRDEAKRMAALKKRMIARINAAKPRLQRSTLLIRGFNCDLVKADDEGITAKPLTGKSEMHEWGGLSNRSVARLVQLVVDRNSADDWLAAAFFALACNDAISAEKHFEKARSLGASVERHLGSLAAAAFAKAKALIQKRRFSEADAALTTIERKYGKTPWFTSSREMFVEARRQAGAGVTQREAEELYARALKLFRKEPSFELRRLIEKLKADYPKSRAVTDAQRKPSLAQMAEAVAKLGKFITVRRDGKGDFKTIQEAIDAIDAKVAGSLIEIQDSRVYNEQIVIPKDKKGMTLRGKKGCWPVITSVGPKRRFNVLMQVDAQGTTIEHVILAHGAPGPRPFALLVRAGPFRLRSAILYIVSVGAGTTCCSIAAAVESKLENCVFVGHVDNSGDLAVRKAIWLRGAFQHAQGPMKLENVVIPAIVAKGACEARFCTVPGKVILPLGSDVVRDSIVGAVHAVKAGTRLEYCDVFGKTPFSGLAKAGKRCFSADPKFIDAGNFNYRLKRTSLCRKRASDGGELGCRHPPEMLEILKLAFELRRKGIIKF